MKPESVSITIVSEEKPPRTTFFNKFFRITKDKPSDHEPDDHDIENQIKTLKNTY
jgi:hypothetical protein